MKDHNRTMVYLMLSAVYLIILIYRQPIIVVEVPEYPERPEYHYLDGFEELAKDTAWLRMYELQINSFDSMAYE